MNLRVRAATLNDAAAIDDLISSYALVYQGRSLKPGSAHGRLAEVDSVPAVVENAAGSVVGFGHVWRAGTVARCYARVHPDAAGQGVGTALMSYLEQRVHDLDLSIINLMQVGTDTAAAELLRERGYTEIRHVLRMQVALDGYQPPPAPAPAPAGVDIVGFDQDRDSAQLFAAHQAAFPDSTDTEEQWWRYRCADPGVEFDPALWFVARQAGQIVGLCLGGRRDWMGSREGYIGDVGVHPDERGRGNSLRLAHHRPDHLRGRRPTDGVPVRRHRQSEWGDTALPQGGNAPDAAGHGMGQADPSLIHPHRTWCTPGHQRSMS